MNIGQIGQIYAKKWNYIIFIPYIKINSKYIKNLNVRPETTELTGSKLFDVSLSNIFLYMSPKARATKVKNKQIGLDQLKRFCTIKENISKMKMQRIEWKII